MILPPCIKRMLSDFRSEYAPLVAGYFRMQKAPPKAVLSALSEYGFDVVVEVLKAYKDRGAVFSCDIVQTNYPDFCDKKVCPLANNFDPLEMAKSIVEKALYVADTGEMIIYFRNSDERMIFDYAKAIRNTRAFAGDFIAKTVLLLGTAIDIRPYKDPDTGERIDPAFEFLMWLGKTAERIVSEDAYGIGAVLQNILQSEPIATEAEARHNPDVRVLVKEAGGRRHLLIDQQYLRFRLRSVLGTQATPMKVNSILATYGVRITRARVGGDRRYFYDFSPEVLERLIGKSVDELLGVADVDELLAKVAEMDKGVGE